MFRLVVDSPHQCVFDTHSAFGRQIIVMSGIEHLGGVEPAVHRDEFIAQLVAGGMQRHRKTDRQPLLGEFSNAGHDADR